MEKHKLLEYNWNFWYDNPFDINTFVISKVPADGNCQFSSIAQTLQNHNISSNSNIINGDYIRKMIAKEIRENKEIISDADINFYISTYRLELESFSSSGSLSEKFQGKWSPYHTHDRNDFSNVILAPYYLSDYNNHPNYMAFQGDNITLAILSKILKLNIIVFDLDKKYANFIDYNRDDHKHKFIPEALLSCTRKFYDNGSHTICLLHHNLSNNYNSSSSSSSLRHYSALGCVENYFDENGSLQLRVRSIFRPNQLPANIKNYLSNQSEKNK
jgi:hypothetical protein